MKISLLPSSALVAICVLFTAGARLHAVPVYEPAEGDVVFQSLPHNPLIDAIEGGSGSPFSHCGILHHVNSGWVVIEAIGPVQETAFVDWVAQGRGHKYSAFRLKPQYNQKIPAFIQAAQSYEGLPYDIHYDMDDAAIYCSELVFKAFRKASGEELGRIQALGDLNWKPFMTVIKQIEGGKLPLERKMITPKSLSEAQQLVKVFPCE